MPLIRCTKKLLKEMGLKTGDLAAGEPDSSWPGGWHANLIYIEGRKCVLFANDKTLFNFLIPDLSRAQIQELDDLFREHLQRIMKEEGLDEKVRERIAGAYRQISYATSNNRSVLGSMNDLAYHYKFNILDQGGLRWCDLPGITRSMNRMPMGAIEYEYPVEAFKKESLAG